jgi:hypothetical protein
VVSDEGAEHAGAESGQQLGPRAEADQSDRHICRRAAGNRAEPPVRLSHQVHQRLTYDEDHEDTVRLPKSTD